MSDYRKVWIATTKDLVKTAKTALEESGRLDRKAKILRISNVCQDEYSAMEPIEALLSNFHALIPTTIVAGSEYGPDSIRSMAFQSNWNLTMHDKDELAIFSSKISDIDTIGRPVSNNPLCKAAKVWLSSLPDITQTTIEHFLRSESWSYQVYAPMLLLGPSAFTSKPWQDLFKSEHTSSRLNAFYSLLCSSTNCTHLAINAPISLHGKTGSDLMKDLNVMRSPSGLVTLYGRFGDPSMHSSQTSFRDALWVDVIQNGIHQTFAPLHTMFSRGNVKEKARMLKIATAQEKPYTAVDLYAGIGYFAFSYAHGGADLVLGWEINGWSIEGFQRGSQRNGWTCTKHSHDGSTSESISQPRLFYDQINQTRLAIFNESNEWAASRVNHLRSSIAPVRHVNCGYLPSSRSSWAVAAQCLDPTLGGSIHAHENVAAGAIEERKTSIEGYFRDLFSSQPHSTSIIIQCEHIERVKWYAPGIIHCVFDIRISPSSNCTSTTTNNH